MTTDVLGNPVKTKLTSGQVHDVTVATQLIADLKSKIIMADATYDSDNLRTQISNLGVSICIKPWRNSKPYNSSYYANTFK